MKGKRNAVITERTLSMFRNFLVENEKAPATIKKYVRELERLQSFLHGRGLCRKLLGLSRKELAGRVGKAEKYCADIERGYCGMSLETMIGLAECLGMSLDYLILGKDGEERINREVERIWFLVKDCDERKRKKAMELLKVYLNE